MNSQTDTAVTIAGLAHLTAAVSSKEEQPSDEEHLRAIAAAQWRLASSD